MLSFVAGILYIIVGIYVFVTQSFAVKLESFAANALGGILCFYGIFRIVRAIIRFRKRDEKL